MDAELWKQVDAMLDLALELPPDEREQFVLSRCDGNEELCNEVQSLIKAQSQAENFMERSAMKIAAQALAEDANQTSYASLVGKEIGTYKVERLLSAGGMGEVYLARETKLDRKVALKILPSHFVADNERASRFAREARALSALNHPNLTTIYEVGSFDGLHFIAMEFVERENLPSETHAGVVLGTLAYMSPEQAVGEAMDQRTDIWSLGVVLYEMVTGSKPFAC